MGTIKFPLTREILVKNNEGYVNWDVRTETVEVPAEKTALIICDMWDTHCYKGITARVNQLAPRIDRLASWLREQGTLIIHAASDTMEFYKEHPARKKLLDTVSSNMASLDEDKELTLIKDYPLPIDDSDNGSDTGETWEDVSRVWACINKAIKIDEKKDIIAGDEGSLIRSCLRKTNRDFLLIAGVATNMCILNRTFAIKAMLSRGFSISLMEQYTDAAYNPERPPYVSHDEGTALTCSYIRKFYCPTIALPNPNY